jgi:hypothetical protein
MIFGICPVMKKIFTILILILSGILTLHSQEDKVIVHAQILEGDTLPQITLKEVEIFSLTIPKSRRGQRRLTRYIRNVKKVYPYAKLAGIQLRKYEHLLVKAENDKERRRLMKQAEKEINEKYGGELSDLTFSQGKILIKLIDRETGESSFNLVQELRGNFTAFFYQAFARIWGYNLKIKYDPKGEDRQLETIVKMIERGQI